MQATEPQIKYLTALAGEREVPAPFDAGIARRLASPQLLSKSDASRWINYLREQPRKATAAPASGSVWAQTQAALADVHTSFYAVPAGYVHAQEIDLYGSDYLFIRVRNYGGKKYVSRVHGSPGEPRYSKLPTAVALLVAPLLAERALEFATLWHQHSGRCGKCNAILTDQRSRERGFGPDCARTLGI